MAKLISPTEYKERLHMTDSEWQYFINQQKELIQQETILYGDTFLIFADMSKDDDSSIPISEIGG